MINKELTEIKHTILYCFDENYNNQAFSSIISLLDCIDEKINILIIHNKNLPIEDLPRIISNHKNLNSIEIKKFKDLNYNFPNLGDNHISVATYFRLFIENYVNEDLSCITYIDADTICVESPLKKITETTNTLLKSNYVLAARTEQLLEENEIEDVFLRLKLDSTYFNAGILVIDLKKWRDNKLTQKLTEKMNAIQKDIVHWDQDVLNSYFNGEYLELDKILNFDAFESDKFPNNLKILHFIGSKKPWYLSGMFNKGSEYYHQNYSKFSKNRYHIVHRWKKSSLIDFFKGFITLKIFKLKSPYLFIKSFVNSLK